MPRPVPVDVVGVEAQLALLGVLLDGRAGLVLWPGGVAWSGVGWGGVAAEGDNNIHRLLAALLDSSWVPLAKQDSERTRTRSTMGA